MRKEGLLEELSKRVKRKVVGDGVERVGKGNGNKDTRSDSVWFHNEDSFSNNIL